MDASAGSPSLSGPFRQGFTLPALPRSDAPETGVSDAVLDVFGGRLTLRRCDRPDGAVTVQGPDDIVLVVRINLLSRPAVWDRPDGDRLKQCVAPDYLAVVAPGDSRVVPAHAAQTVLELRGSAALWEHASDGRLGPVMPRLRGRLLADGLLTRLVERIFDVASRDSELAAILLRALALDLADRGEHRARTGWRRGGLTDRQLSLLRGHVEAGLERRLPLAELAGLVGLSTHHFARSFKVSMGMAPAAWIRLRRLTVGQGLLRQPHQPVTAVAAAVGYDSPSRFARAFRQMTGETPSDFRRRIATDGV